MIFLKELKKKMFALSQKQKIIPIEQLSTRQAYNQLITQDDVSRKALINEKHSRFPAQYNYTHRQLILATFPHFMKISKQIKLNGDVFGRS